MFSLSEFWCWLCASWKSGKERKEWKYFAELMRPINSEDKVLKVCLVLSYDFRLHVGSSSTKQIKLYGPFINISIGPLTPAYGPYKAYLKLCLYWAAFVDGFSLCGISWLVHATVVPVLRYNWHAAQYKFKVCSEWAWLTYTVKWLGLVNIHHLI